MEPRGGAGGSAEWLRPERDGPPTMIAAAPLSGAAPSPCRGPSLRMGSGGACPAPAGSDVRVVQVARGPFGPDPRDPGGVAPWWRARRGPPRGERVGAGNDFDGQHEDQRVEV